jgi:hypothetical protein
MLRRASVLACVGILLLAVAVPAMANGPAERFTEDVTGDQFVCEDAIYTITSGQISIVFHEGESASGNQNFTITATPRKVVAEDEHGNQFRIVGAFWAGATFNANTGGEQFTLTDKFQIVSRGKGSVDSSNVTFHVTAQPNNLVVKEFDFGTCVTPAD